MEKIISFPNIGINELKINPVAIPFTEDYGIRWYGIIIVSAIIMAVLYVFFRSKKTEITEDNLYDLSIWLIVAGIVGARAYYVLTSLDSYDSFLDYFKIWKGGMAFYGGVIGGGIAAAIVCKVKKINFPLLADMVGPALLLAQAIGRWGNFFNGEAYGVIDHWDFFGKSFEITGVTELPWIMYIDGEACQPTFLYECIWNLIGFTILALLYKKRAFNGQIFLGYLCWYGLGRMVIEGFREDSLLVGGIRISQLVGLLTFILGGALMIAVLIMKKKGKLPAFLDKERIMHPTVDEEDEPYEPMFAGVSTKEIEETENISEQPIEEDEENGKDN